MYIELLKKSIMGLLYEPIVMDRKTYKENNSNSVATEEQINEGKYFGKYALTAIGKKRIDNLQFCIEDVFNNNIEGDMIETDVWRGGATIFMKGLCNYYNKDKKIFVADSFEGCPSPDISGYEADLNSHYHNEDVMNVSYEEVINNFKKYDLLDSNVIFLKGWFKDTLYTDKINKLSILRLDGDMYCSTYEALDALYDKVSIGGYIIIDDYGTRLGACKKAIEDFFKAKNLNYDLISIDWTGVYFKKT
jgi:hypothetical protein